MGQLIAVTAINVPKAVVATLEVDALDPAVGQFDVNSVSGILLTNFPLDLIGLDPPGLYDRFPARDFAHDVQAKCLRRCRHGNRAFVGETGL